jgi:hypothetical protein
MGLLYLYLYQYNRVHLLDYITVIQLNQIKGKTVHAMKAHGVAEVQVLSFLIPALSGSGQLYAPALLPFINGSQVSAVWTYVLSVTPVLLALETVLSLTQINIKRHSIRRTFKKTQKLKSSRLQLSDNTTNLRLPLPIIPLFAVEKSYTYFKSNSSW